MSLATERASEHLAACARGTPIGEVPRAPGKSIRTAGRSADGRPTGATILEEARQRIAGLACAGGGRDRQVAAIRQCLRDAAEVGAPRAEIAALEEELRVADAPVTHAAPEVAARLGLVDLPLLVGVDDPLVGLVVTAPATADMGRGPYR